MAGQVKFCRKCGKQINANAAFCRFCGFYSSFSSFISSFR